jgi:hypothetical protein
VRQNCEVLPPDCVQPAPWSLEVFRSCAPDGPKTDGDARGVTPPAEFDLRTPPRCVTAHGGARAARFLPGLSAPPALAERGSHDRYAGHSNSRLRSAFRVSHPPDGLTPPRTLPACFIRLTLLGFRSPEPCSSVAAVAPLGAHCRPDVHRPPALAASRARAPWCPNPSGSETDEQPVFTALLHQRSPLRRHAR